MTAFPLVALIDRQIQRHTSVAGSFCGTRHYPPRESKPIVYSIGIHVASPERAVVTRDTKDYAASAVRAVSPEEFLLLV
jgi:hypothetical protein